MSKNEKLAPHYIRLMSVLHSLGLDFKDANKVTKRGIASYRLLGKNCFGDTQLNRLRDSFGINPTYIRTGEGEQTVPGYAEKVYNYLNDIEEGNRQPPLYPNINFRRIEDLPEDIRLKILKDVTPIKFIQIPKMDHLSIEQMDAVLDRRESIIRDSVDSINTMLDFLKIIRDGKYGSIDSPNADENNSSAETC